MVAERGVAVGDAHARRLHRSHYRILELDLSLETDAKAFHQLFERDYGWFQTPDAPAGAMPVRVILGGSGRDPFVRVGGERFSLAGHPSPVSCAYQRLSRALFNRLESFLLLHAGVVERGGAAVILAGPPGIGKTTLVLELVARGFRLFSDDLCPVHLGSRSVHPFPRSVWVAPSPHPPAGRGDGQASVALRGRKVPLGTREMAATVGTRPCPPGCVLVLDAGAGETAWCRLEVGLKPGGEAFLDEVARRSEAVTVESLHPGLSAWRIEYPRQPGLTAEIRDLLERHRARIWNAFRLDTVQPDFSRPPSLEPLSRHETAFRLMRDLKQGLAGRGGKVADAPAPGRLLSRVTGLLDGVPCHRLTVGELAETCERVLEVARG